MKKLFNLFSILLIAFTSNAQTSLSSADSIRVFYDSLFSTLKSDYLYKKSTNWAVIEPEIKENLKQYDTFKNALAETTILFDKINATHCQLFYKDTVITATYNGPNENDFSEQWIKKYITNPAFDVKVLENKYGYVLMPSILFEDITPEKIRSIAQPLYDQIAEIKSKNKLKGWIIDLRFNTGGNIYPMLLALYDFLGDNHVWGVLDINKNEVLKIELSQGKYLENKREISSIKHKGELLDTAKTAIITNIATASSGEITAISFKGRKNTLFIGETTTGMTTTNDKRELPFGAFMALTTGFDSNRNGMYYEKITPDILTSKQDNFENLLSDKNIQEAIKWINK